MLCNSESRDKKDKKDGNSVKEQKNAIGKNIVTEMKKVFNGLVSRLDTAAELTSELEDISIRSFKTKKTNRRNTEKSGTIYPRTIE